MAKTIALQMKGEFQSDDVEKFVNALLQHQFEEISRDTTHGLIVLQEKYCNLPRNAAWISHEIREAFQKARIGQHSTQISDNEWEDRPVGYKVVLSEKVL